MTAAAPAGLSREGAAALALEVSRAPGYRGEVLRLVGEAAAGDAGWAVRVRAVVAGGSRLLRSREAWDRFRGSTRGEMRQMVGTERAAEAAEAPPTNGHGGAPTASGYDFEGHPLLDEMEAAAAAAGGPGLPGTPRGALGRWRAATEATIAEAEREAARLLGRAAALREQAAGLTQDVRLLRRALAAVPDQSAPAAPAPVTRADGSPIRLRVLDWGRGHGGDVVVAAATAGLGLSVKQVSDAAGQLQSLGYIERVGKGHYRLVRPTEPGR